METSLHEVGALAVFLRPRSTNRFDGLLSGVRKFCCDESLDSAAESTCLSEPGILDVQRVDVHMWLASSK